MKKKCINISERNQDFLDTYDLNGFLSKFVRDMLDRMGADANAEQKTKRRQSRTRS